MDWDKNVSLLLIQEYSKHGLLWDPKHPQHFNKTKKAEAWDEMARACFVDVAEAKRKMSSLLGSFRRERAKGRRSTRTGTGVRKMYKSNWFAFKSFAFLMDRNQDNHQDDLMTTSVKIEDMSDSNNSVGSDYSTQVDSEDIENFLNSTHTDPIIHAEHFSIPLESDIDNIQNNADVVQRIHSVNVNNFTNPTTLNHKRACEQVDATEDSRVKKTFQFLQQPLADPSMIYALHLANKLKQFQGKTRTLVEHAINQVIFDAEMGLYDTSQAHLSPCSSTLKQLAKTTVTSPSSASSCHSPERENIPSPTYE